MLLELAAPLVFDSAVKVSKIEGHQYKTGFYLSSVLFVEIECECHFHLKTWNVDFAWSVTKFTQTPHIGLFHFYEKKVDLTKWNDLISQHAADKSIPCVIWLTGIGCKLQCDKLAGWKRFVKSKDETKYCIAFGTSI